MKIDTPIAVTSRTFSQHTQLRDELEQIFSNVLFNTEGHALKGDALVKFLKNRKGAIVALEPMTSDVFSQLPDLKYVSKYGVGLDNLDQESMKRLGVNLGWSGGVNRRSVSELTLSFALGLVRKSFQAMANMSQREWAFEKGSQLTSKTVGVIGCGYIGKDLIQLLKPFNCKILVHDILNVENFCNENGATQTSKEILLAQSDIVTLHIPYGPSTHHFISESELKVMKVGSVLINTSRGNIVDEAALYDSLKSGHLSAAAADVFAVEPCLESPLLGLKQFWGTPHLGGSSHEAILAMGRSAIENLKNMMKA